MAKRDRPAPTPPAAWDEWAMRRATAVYDDTLMQHMGSDSRCRAAIHVALIDAMRLAAEAERERWATAAAKVLCEPGNPGYRDALRAVLAFGT